ncbi:MAG TPA: RpiB/LacA/LacB family sugar-phosphate isomerase [Candidatus Paceibacterota bacterium]
MKLIIGADHAGYGMKEALKQSLILSGHDVKDVGAYTYDVNDDYPDFVKPLVEEVLATSDSQAIFCAGSGQGEAIAANRHKGIRAAVYCHHDLEVARLSRADNNANVLSIGARFVSAEDAKEAVALWLTIPFDPDPNSRHARRLAKIDQ